MSLQEKLTELKKENLAKFPEEIKNVLLNDLEKHYGEGQFDVPLAATYVVDVDGSIACAVVEADYTIRAEPSDLVEVLESVMK